MKIAAAAVALVLISFLETPVESVHIHGAGGLEGWTLSSHVAELDDERYPTALVIARRGETIRKFGGDPFLWRWMFLKDGKRVAYELGPRHFAMRCVLSDIDSGKELESIDCFRDLPASSPAWARHLETQK